MSYSNGVNLLKYARHEVSAMDLLWTERGCITLVNWLFSAIYQSKAVNKNLLMSQVNTTELDTSDSEKERYRTSQLRL